MKNEEMSVAALIDEIRIARRTMSTKNPHHGLLLKCEAAVAHLSMQLHYAKAGQRSWWRRLLGATGTRVRTVKS